MVKKREPPMMDVEEGEQLMKEERGWLLLVEGRVLSSLMEARSSPVLVLVLLPLLALLGAVRGRGPWELLVYMGLLRETC